MTRRTDDQLTLFGKFLYHEALEGQDQDDGGLIPIGYAEIESFCGAGWFYCRDGLHYSPLFYHPAPLMDESDSASNDVVALNISPETLDNSLPDFSKSGIEGGDHPNFERGDRVIGQCQKTDKLISGIVWAVGNKFLRLYDDRVIKIDTASVIGQAETHDIALTNNSKTEHRWVETTYVVKAGKRYGPYRVERWRDQNGKRRSRYLGKAPKETAAHGQPDSDQPPHSASDSVCSSAP